MTGQKPSIGRIVHYALSDGDVRTINQKRAALVHAGGNPVQAGQVYPAMIVRTWGDEAPSPVQLQVFLDGNDTYWASSAPEGDGPGTWSWPPRAP